MASNNNEGGGGGGGGGGEDTSGKAQTEVDGPSAERFDTTPARPKARTEPRRMEKGNNCESTPDRDKIGKGTQVRIFLTGYTKKWQVTNRCKHMSVICI